jgi:hypothetical protein
MGHDQPVLYTITALAAVMISSASPPQWIPPRVLHESSQEETEDLLARYAFHPDIFDFREMSRAFSRTLLPPSKGRSLI